jgi:colicin import membrane protein/DNA methyltransferase 1-associated protein 1
MAQTAEEKAAAKAAKDAEKAAAKAAKDAEKAAAKAARTSVVVSYPGGTREFSQKVHGDEFENLAEQFAAKFKGTVA